MADKEVKGDDSNFHYIPNEKLNWNDAKERCANMGMELARFSSELEYEAGVNYITNMGSTNDVWVGVSSDGTTPYEYKWTDGEPTFWFTWIIGEPNSQESEQCVRIKRNNNYGYATRQCSFEFDYLCSCK
ncbi:C-type lectin mannose-binding isoform-like [Mytilus trossulus]|uniref:C-type lectin mannose-binding isoform-like n=1 Tax=Mytilus trossulus TaxID=6551 RepID=UPI0030078481